MFNSYLVCFVFRIPTVPVDDNTMATNIVPISLFPSPAKMSKNTEYSKCIICQESDDHIQTIIEQSYNSIVGAIECRQDTVAKRLECDINTKDNFFAKNPKWHETCRVRWTSKRNLKYSCKRKRSPSHTIHERKSTRNNTPDFNFKTMCLICGKTNLPGKRKHDKLHRVMCDSVQGWLYTYAKDTCSDAVLHRIEGDNTSLDLVAMEGRYHKLCYDTLRNKARPTQETRPDDVYVVAFNKLCEEIETPLTSGKLLCLSGLIKRYLYRSLNTWWNDP